MLTEGTTLGGLSHIPLEDVLIRDAGLLEGSDGTGAAAAESANDDDAGHAAGLLDTLVESGLDV